MKAKYIIIIALRYLSHRRFATSVSVIAIALSLLFVVGLGTINFAIKKTAVEGSIRYPLVVGSAGSSGVQLILSTMFFIDKPSGTIPFSVYEDLKADKRVIKAYPIAVADTYKNLRIIGSNEEYVKDFDAGLLSGKIDFSKLENTVFGYAAAKRAGVKVGDGFYGQHGMVGGGSHQHKELQYKVTGILKQTGRPEDMAIYVNYKSVWHIHKHHNHHKPEEMHKEHAEHEHAKHDLQEHDHAKHDLQEHDHAKHDHAKHDLQEHDHAKHEGYAEHDHAEHDHQEHKQDKYTLSDNKLTAVLLKTGNPAYTGMLEREYTLRDGTLAVDTSKSIREFVNHINKGEVFVELMSIAMLAIAMIMILVTLVMSLNERSKDLALMRSLGIGRFTISLTVMVEALIITFSGAIIGVALGHLMVFSLQDMIVDFVGVDPEPFAVTKMEFLGIISTLAAGQLLALVSMIWTYRMNLVEEIARD